MSLEQYLKDEIPQNVSHALEEDIRDGDITALLIPEQQQASATVITREQGVICGIDWVNETFRQVDATVTLEWQVQDGDNIEPNQILVNLSGSARSLFTAERTALNFLQTLSGTATTASEYAKLVAGTDIKILDTRKTLPGLRLAQKYAIKTGGCHNHRIGLYDAFLIKENHIAACGSITAAVTQARTIAPAKTVEVEVENLDELQQALTAGSDIIMLDNFSVEQIHQAIAINQGQAKLEVSGNLDADNINDKRITGIDYLSSGSLTKHCRAIDLSMRIKAG